MRVVLLGPPGAGKGTQAGQLAEKLEVPHLSTGDLFRENIGNGTKLGLEAKRYLDAGDLVPSELTNELVDDRLNNPYASEGFILDGYPRSVPQAQALDKMLVYEYDCIILDLNLPGGSGLNLLKELKKEKPEAAVIDGRVAHPSRRLRRVRRSDRRLQRPASSPNPPEPLSAGGAIVISPARSEAECRDT